jgi:hypothetical protein
MTKHACRQCGGDMGNRVPTAIYCWGCIASRAAVRAKVQPSIAAKRARLLATIERAVSQLREIEQ